MADSDFSSCGLHTAVRYDENTGEFRRILINTAGIYKDKPTGKVRTNGYVTVVVFGKAYGAHRLAWFYTHGKWPEHTLDHIDGDKTNNRISNLREATSAENSQNRKRGSKGSASGLIGVTPAPFDKWMARICIGGKTKYLGHHLTPEDAHAAYLTAKRQYHPFGTI